MKPHATKPFSALRHWLQMTHRAIIKTPHHYTREKLQADTTRQGWSVRDNIKLAAVVLGYQVHIDQVPWDAMGLVQFINYIEDES